MSPMNRKTGAAKHIHKYRRVNLTRDPNKKPYYVYQCTLPVCSHYIQVKLSLGKMCLCNRCKEPFIITKETLNGAVEREEAATVFPHCIDCTKSRTDKAAVLVDLSEFLNHKV